MRARRRIFYLTNCSKNFTLVREIQVVFMPRVHAITQIVQKKVSWCA